MFKKSNIPNITLINCLPKKLMSEINQKDDAARAFLSTSLKEIMSLIGAECGSLFIFDAGKEELVLNSYYNSQDLHIEGLRKKIGDGVLGKVLDTKQPILVKDIDRDLRFKRNGYSHYKTGSFIALPLFGIQGNLVGLINLADKSSGEPFSEKDMEFAVTISRYACVTLDSLRNYAALLDEKENIVKQKTLLEKYASVGKLAAGVVHEVGVDVGQHRAVDLKQVRADIPDRPVRRAVSGRGGSLVHKHRVEELRLELGGLQNVVHALHAVAHEVLASEDGRLGFEQRNVSVDAVRERIDRRRDLARRLHKT